MKSTLQGTTTVERMFSASTSPASFARRYFDQVATLLAQVDTPAVEEVVNALLTARAQGRSIFIFGNGGSAATAGHFASDLAVGIRSSLPFRAYSLVENTALLSAVANDHGYEEVFVRQLHDRLQPGDVVLAISASGRSANVLNAVRYANECGAVTVGFTAFDGGELRPLVKLGVHVPSERGQYGPAEDIHLIFEHAICNYLRLALAPERGP